MLPSSPPPGSVFDSPSMSGQSTVSATGSGVQSQRFVLGVSGAYCAGKSTVVGLLKQLMPAAVHLDVDKLGHEAYAPCVQALVEAFGAGILFDPVVPSEPVGSADSSDLTASAIPSNWTRPAQVDRKKLGKLVFAQPQGLLTLETILHPWMVDELRKRIAQASGLVIVDAALLFYMGLHQDCDAVIHVRAPVWIRRIRAKKRDGLSPQAIAARIRSQVTRIPPWKIPALSPHTQHPSPKIAQAQSQTPGWNADIHYVSNIFGSCTRRRVLRILAAFRGGSGVLNPAKTAWIKNEQSP